MHNFIVEPFLPHPANTEFYVCINSVREGDVILFTHEGGVEVGDVDSKALKLLVPVNGALPSRQEIASVLLKHVPQAKHEALVDFLIGLYNVYADLHFAYLEINPLICLDAEAGQQPQIFFVDMAAKLDQVRRIRFQTRKGLTRDACSQTADFICGPKWAIARDTSAANTPATSKVMADRGPPMVFPAPFGRDLTKEEAYIAKLDASTGASLKLTVLNPEGRVWTMVAGGGASVVYS